MSHTPLYSFLIGPYGLPQGSLTNVENVQDAAGKYLYPPQSFGSYLPGAPINRLTGVEFERGFPTVEWNWTGNAGKGYITYGGAKVLRSTFWGTLWSNTLTIYTPTTTALSYELYDCVGTIRKYPESAPNFKVFNSFGIRFSHLVSR